MLPRRERELPGHAQRRGAHGQLLDAECAPYHRHRYPSRCCHGKAAMVEDGVIDGGVAGRRWEWLNRPFQTGRLASRLLTIRLPVAPSTGGTPCVLPWLLAAFSVADWPARLLLPSLRLVPSVISAPARYSPQGGG